jgi:membrane protease YdiL (CAAX protease family)
MLIGLIAPAVVSTVFIHASKDPLLIKDTRQKVLSVSRLDWKAILIATAGFCAAICLSILASMAFGGSSDQFAFTSDFSFTGVGFASALLTIVIASIIEEVGWRGYAEDSIGNSMDWFRGSMIFGVVWACWHIPLLFIPGTYQAGLVDLGPMYVTNFLISSIPLAIVMNWVYIASRRSMLACMFFHLFVNFMQEKIAMSPDTKCIETLIMFAFAAMVILWQKELFFETDHVGNLPGIESNS